MKSAKNCSFRKTPQVRKELASNSGTPREFLENLVDDEDPDVAREAESLLDDWDDEEDDD